MKASRIFQKTTYLFLGILLLLSCSDDDSPTQFKVQSNIVELAEASPDLSTLVAALKRANLVEALNGSGQFTVFAPTNAAFDNFLSDNGFDSLNDVPQEVLSQVLLNHVISGDLKSSSLTTGYGETLATEASSNNNLNIFINTASGVTLNGVSNVTNPDIDATNGVVHIVDAVIGLPTVVDFALADTNTFSILVSALTRSDLTFDYVTTLSTPNGSAPAPFTVFAPTNDAFINVLAELGVSTLEEIDEPTLKATLDLHAVAGANVLAAALQDDMPIGTLGGEITANVTGGNTLTDSNGRISNIVVTNVQAVNGVIHVVDKVVLPKLPENLVSKAYNTPELSILFDALQAADGDLPSILSSEGPFTVLAPTNDAFAAFLADNNFGQLSDVPTDILAQVLLNHVISGPAIMSTDLVSAGSGYASTEATGAGGNKMSLYYDTQSGVTFNGISTVSTPDVEATNGVVHIVDAVIGLPTIVDHALANTNFSSLVGALTTGGNTTFTDLLSTPGDFTVFAPTNDAFAAFANPNGNALDAILSNHVVVGATAVSSGLENSYVKTAATFGATDNNLSMYISTDGGNVTLNGVSTVAIPDVIASNGVIHAVNAVIDIPTVVTFVVADPTFSTLLSALTTLTPSTDFASVLSTSNGTSPTPFTVFAPTDAAFADITVPTDENILADILRHHVIAGLNVTSGDLNNPGDTTAPSLEGDDLTITLPGTGENIANLTDGSGNNDIGIVDVDVQAGNGVIHVINKVAIPDLTN